MKRRALFLLPIYLLGCSGSDDGTSVADADYGDGPVTYRPDDGVDTATADTGSTDDGSTEASSDATTGDATSEASSDAASDASDASAAGTPSNARINEVYADRALEGDPHEYVEISGPAGIALDALHLRIIKPDGSVFYDVAVADAGTKMPASGLWVVGGTLATTDKSYGLTSWGLPADSGAIQLTRNDGVAVELVDVVAYGVAPAAPSTEPKKVVEGAPAALPPSGSTGKTFGRKSVPGDTDSNSVDFCVMNATPKAANGPCI